jgi:hypothetical protein
MALDLPPSTARSIIYGRDDLFKTLNGRRKKTASGKRSSGSFVFLCTEVIICEDDAAFCETAVAPHGTDNFL